MDDRLTDDDRAVGGPGDVDDGDGAVLARRRPARRGGQVGDHVAEAEDHPHAVDLLDRLEHVGVVADDEVDDARRGDLLGDRPLFAG